MNQQEAIKLYESLSTDGQQALECGNLTEYLLSLDPETIAERIADEIGSARTNLQEELRAAFATHNVPATGAVVLGVCRALRTTYQEQFNELSGWVQQWTDEHAERRVR